MQLNYQHRFKMKLPGTLSMQSNYSTDAGTKTEIKGLNVSIHKVRL